VFCKLTDPRITDACVRSRTILLDNMRHGGILAQELDPERYLRRSWIYEKISGRRLDRSPDFWRKIEEGTRTH